MRRDSLLPTLTLALSLVAAALPGCDDGGDRPAAAADDDRDAGRDGGRSDATVGGDGSAPPGRLDGPRPRLPEDLGVTLTGDFGPGWDGWSPRDAEPSTEADAVVAGDASPLDRPARSATPFGPAARIEHIELPDSPEAARRAGCDLHGPHMGTLLRNLLLVLGGGLSRFAHPDANGRVGLVVLVRAAGWPDGGTARDVERVELQVMEGAQDQAMAFVVRRRALLDGDWARGPRSAWADVPVESGWIETPPGPLILPLPLLSGPAVELPLHHARVRGRLTADGPGVRLGHGLITGFVTADGIRSLVRQVRALCLGPEPPGVCTLIGGQINRPEEELYSLVAGIVGGFDSRVVNGVPEPCDAAVSDACDAVALCLEARGGGVVVVGVEAEQPESPSVDAGVGPDAGVGLDLGVDAPLDAGREPVVDAD